MKKTLLALSITAALLTSGGLAAQDHSNRANELDKVVVAASPLRHGAEDVVRPVEILAGTELDDSREATLGDTVSKLPGVQSSFFGAGVGRPIIRGLDGPRVQVLSEGLGTLDVSTVSVDHAVTIEPFLADQIEVLKGPATLLFGSGAVGGAVNVVDGRIHEERVDGISGRTELRGNTVADERAGMFRVDAGAGNVVVHADTFYRETDDYEIPGFAELEHDDHDHGDGDDDDHGHEEPAQGLLENSATRTRGGAVGASYVGERGFAGMSLSRHESRYGVPGHEHDDHVHDDDHGDESNDDHGDGDDPEEHGGVVIDMKQTRVDVKAGLDQPFAGHQSLRVRMAHNDYEHVELEGDEIGTRFDNTGVEGRVELVHDEIAGWTGAYGLQFGRRDFKAVGEEAFVPPSESTDLGLFLIERRQWDRLLLEVGGRIDRQKIDPESPHPSRDFDAFSVSMAGEWRFSDRWHLRLGIDRAQRAPGAEELYSDGLHVATGSYEIGDVDLGRETSNQAELGVHYHSDPIELKVSTYVNRFDDFIHLAETGEEIDHVEVHQWQQADARFHGAEVEVKIKLVDNGYGRYQLRLLADTVRGKLDDGGGNLPRIAPGRFGAGLDWSLGNWRAGLSAVRYRSQNDVAEHETATDGYTLVDADLAYAFDIGENEMEVFVQGRNLSDEEARLHTSFLKNIAPLPGRSIGFGVRAFF
jgi:iron complex outermembrane receptor protein